MLILYFRINYLAVVGCNTSFMSFHTRSYPSLLNQSMALHYHHTRKLRIYE